MGVPQKVVCEVSLIYAPRSFKLGTSENKWRGVMRPVRVNSLREPSGSNQEVTLNLRTGSQAKPRQSPGDDVELSVAEDRAVDGFIHPKKYPSDQRTGNEENSTTCESHGLRHLPSRHGPQQHQ